MVSILIGQDAMLFNCHVETSELPPPNSYKYDTPLLGNPSLQTFQPAHYTKRERTSIQPTMRKPKSKSLPTRVLLPRRTTGLNAIPGMKLLARGKTWNWPHWPCVVTVVHNNPVPKLTVSFYPDHTFARVDPTDCLDLTHNEVNRVIDYAQSKPRLAKTIPVLLDAVFSANLLFTGPLCASRKVANNPTDQEDEPNDDTSTTVRKDLRAGVKHRNKEGYSGGKHMRPDNLEDQAKPAKIRKVVLPENGKFLLEPGTNPSVSHPYCTKYQVLLPPRKRLHFAQISLQKDSHISVLSNSEKSRKPTPMCEGFENDFDEY